MPRLSALETALDAMPEPLVVVGTIEAPTSIALAIPEAPVATLGDARAFVETLLANAEPAPFGDGTRTRVDRAVRDALRLRARASVEVIGFDPEKAGVLEAVERALSPREKLRATLTDVLVYPPGGKFERHVDTPRGPEMVGTLVVQ